MSDNAKELPKIRVWKKDEMSKRIAFFKDLKGSKKGECGISDLHSLVFYNFSDQSDFLVTYSLEVKDIIEEKFGIILDYEPSIFS